MQQQIAVAMHKEAWYPADSLYLPVQAGAALHAPLGVTGDDTGVSISRSNPQYSELTALYWLWQNSGAQVRGLCHYRRYFAGRRLGTKAQRILTGDRLDALMQSADVIVPVPRLYLIETNRSHYAHAHRAQDLDAVRQVIADMYPESLSAFDRVMDRRWGRRFNMCIMKRGAFDRYCTWLFSILSETEKRLCDPPPRTMGFLAERLMDVWLLKERPRMRQLPVIHLESQHWPRKIAGFLMRKFRGTRHG